MAIKRTDGRFTVTLDIGVDGQRKRKFFYGKTITEAKQKRAAYIKAHPADSPLAHADSTLAEWADWWFPLYNTDIAKRTVATREIALKQIKAALGSIPLTDVRPSQIREYMNTLAGKDKSTISMHKNLLRKMFDVALQERLIVSSPCAGMHTPKARQRQGHRLLSEWEQNVIKTAAPHSRVGIWAMLMMYAGLRREEMAALRWTDIDMNTRLLTVAQASELNSAGEMKSPKTAAGFRTIPIVPPLYAVLDAVPVHDRYGLVCTNAAGDPLTVTSYRQGWSSFMRVCLRVANNIEPYGHTIGWRVDKSKEKLKEKWKDFACTAHDLRYTYATILYDAGVDVQTAASLLGHSDVTVTMRIYTKLSEKTKALGWEKLTAYFGEEI